MRDSSHTVREADHTVPEHAATVRESDAGGKGGATVREGGAAVHQGGATVREGSTATVREPQAVGWLPPTLAADYRVVESLPAVGGEADLYIVGPHDEAADGTRRVAKVYRQGFQPKEDVLRRVRDADPSHVIRIESYGEDAGRWWELMEYAERGSLRMLIQQEGPRFPEALVREILRQVNDALTGLHALPLEHRDLKPANVLVRSRDPLDLVLTDFGIASVMHADVHMTGMARTIRYAPPEALGSVVSDQADQRNVVIIERTTWDYWSLGMMIVEMLNGTHPWDELEEANIAHQLLVTRSFESLTEGVEDPRWRKLCRGLLRRQPAARWDEEAVSKWLTDPDDPSLDVAEEASAAGPGADASPAAMISFDGTSYATPADLGVALSRDWVKATSFWTRRLGDVRTWAFDGLGLQALGDALTKIDDSDSSLDAQVFSFVYHMAPHAPVRFRDEDITATHLAELGELAAIQQDRRAEETMLALYRQRILTLAGALPERDELADISRRWDDAVADYARRRQALNAEGVYVPEPDDDELVLLLAASLPGSAVVAPLRARARDANTEDAQTCGWYADLGTPDDMSAAALVMLPHLQAPAEREGRKARGRPRRGCIGGVVVGGLFGLLAVNAVSLAGGGGGLGTAVILPLAFLFAFRAAHIWYREDTLRLGGFFGDLDVIYKRLKWPFIVLGAVSLLFYLSLLALVAGLTAYPFSLFLNALPSEGIPGDGYGLLWLVPLLLYSLLGGFIGLQAQSWGPPVGRALRRLTNIATVRPRTFLVIVGSVPIILIMVL